MSIFHFENCRVDPERRELTRAGELVDLQPLIFDLLLFFLQHPNRVVTKEEMLQAAWRSTVVTDSVVARGVMKLRRAIGDDAAQARLVLTVHRVGYRFVADVRLLEAPPPLLQPTWPDMDAALDSLPLQGLALAHFDNLSGDTTLDAWLPELDQALRHLVLAHTSLASTSGADALQQWRAASRAEDPLATACAKLHVQELAVPVVLRSAGQFTVRLLRGGRTDAASTVVFTGDDLLQLATRLADQLSGVHASALTPPAGAHLAFWQTQHARAVRLQAQGEAAAALELLELCTDHLVPSLPMGLMLASLYQAVGEPALAQAALAEAAGLLPADDRPSWRLALHQARAELAIQQGRPEDGVLAGTEALGLLRVHPELAGEAPRLILRIGDALAAAGRGADAVQLAERAVASAQRLGQPAVALSCRLALGRTLLQLRQLHRASASLRRVLDSAGPEDGLVLLEAQLLLAEAQRDQRNFQACLDLARQARSQARRLRPGWIGRALALELEGLLGASDTPLVAQWLAQRWRFDGALDPAAPVQVLLADACVTWRLGAREAALAALRQALDAWPDGASPIDRGRLLAELCFMAAPLGLPLDAALVAEAQAAANPWLRARLAAAQDLAQGRRAQARQHLWTCWTSQGSNPWDGFDVTVDLAWMLLEDGEADDLERVIAQVLELPSDHAPVHLLRSAYALQPLAPEPRQSAWALALAEFPGLLREHPGLARGIGLFKLPELLSRACHR